MGYGAAAEYGPVVHVGLAGYAYVAYQYAVVAYGTVVCDVGVGHKEHIVAYPGHTLAAGLGAAVDGGTFADVHPVAYLDVSHLTFELEVLRYGAHNRTREDRTVLAHLHVVEYGGVRENAAAVSDFYEFVNECVRSDFDVLAYLRIRMHSGQWMNLAHFFT